MTYKQVDQGYIVRLNRGEEIVATLTEFADDVNLKSGFVTGLGAICDIELGFFDFQSKEYIRKEFGGDYELVNLTGNFSILDGRPFLHAHITIADSECRPFAGHLYSANVAVTGEFLVTSTGVEVVRKPDEETGLNLLEL
jgi:predicted DNA-binding protein with PD1-like motif